MNPGEYDLFDACGQSRVNFVLRYKQRRAVASRAPQRASRQSTK
jgi:hypothetical protein